VGDFKKGKHKISAEKHLNILISDNQIWEQNFVRKIKIVLHDVSDESNDCSKFDPTCFIKFLFEVFKCKRELKFLNAKENAKTLSKNYYSEKHSYSNNSFVIFNETVVCTSCRAILSDRLCEFKQMPAKERPIIHCLFCPSNFTRARDLKRHMCWKHNRGSDDLKKGEDLPPTASYRLPTDRERAIWPVKEKMKRKKSARQVKQTPEYEDISAEEDLNEEVVSIDLLPADEVIVEPPFQNTPTESSTSSRQDTFADNVGLILQRSDDHRDNFLTRRLTAPAADGSVAQLDDDNDNNLPLCCWAKQNEVTKTRAVIVDQSVKE